MGRAEYAGLGSLATGLASGIEGERERRQREKYAKRQDWLQCIMSGDSAEACAQITGYQPEPQESAGATRFQSEAEARKRAGEERTAIGKLSPEEYTVAHTRTIPGQDITMRSRLPSGEIGSTVMGQTREKEIYLPDLGPREDYRGALDLYAKKRDVAKKRGELSEKLATEERTKKEKRAFREVTDEAIIKRKLRERRLGLTEGKAEPADPIEKIRQSMVKGVVEFNTKKARSIEFGYIKSARVPSTREIETMLGIGGEVGPEPQGDPKAEAQAVFDEMNVAKMDRDAMLKKVDEQSFQLESMGVDVAYLRSLINE